MNQQENEVIESKDKLKKCVTDLQSKAEKIEELELHKKRLTLYITELQKRYKEQKEKKEELKKAIPENTKLQEENPVAESESSELESLNGYVANINSEGEHASTAQVITNSQLFNHQGNSANSQPMTGTYYTINGIKMDEKMYTEYKKSQFQKNLSEKSYSHPAN